MKIAVIQTNAKNDKGKNNQDAAMLCEFASKANAKFVLFPEVFNFRGDLSNNNTLKKVAESIPGPTTKYFAKIAKRRKIFILLGSIYEKSKYSNKVYNTSVLINDHGKIQAKYRKMNMFDAVIGKVKIRESNYFIPGKKLTLTKIKNFKIGLSICYDLRFPELYRQYSRRGAHILCIPSSFTKKTGQAHWEALLRARAIENLCYVVAPNQAGKDGKGVECYGNSMMVSPWGEVMARAQGKRKEVIIADVSLNEIEKAKKLLPGIKK